MSNPDQSPALSLEEFRHWLNNRRMMDVSMAFGDIVERYREATEAAAMAATVPAVPVYWEFRWKDTHPQTVTSGQWYPWEKVVPRNGHLETVESRLAELRDYIAQGKCYEIRALYTQAPVAGQPAEPSPADLWYLQDTRSYVGNDVLWWAREGAGYTTDVSKAHVFTREEAFRQAAMRGCDRAWPKAYIDGKTRPAVDMQYINHDEALAAPKGDSNG